MATQQNNYLQKSLKSTVFKKAVESDASSSWKMNKFKNHIQTKQVGKNDMQSTLT